MFFYWSGIVYSGNRSPTAIFSSLQSLRIKPNATPSLFHASNNRMKFCITNKPVSSIPQLTFQAKDPEQVGIFCLERLRGIEPLSLPWQGRVLPLNHSRMVPRVRIELTTRCSSGICSTTELPRRLYSLLNVIFWWAIKDSNLWPSRCKRDALTN